MTKFARFLFVSVFMVSLTSCFGPSSEELAKQQLAMFDNLDAMLLYETEFVSSGATGNCAGVYVDQWYGADTPFKDISASYEEQLSGGKWQLWSENVIKVWHLETRKGLYSIRLQDSSEEVDPEQVFYTIPEEMMPQMVSHSTIYLVRMGFMRSARAAKCFGN